MSGKVQVYISTVASNLGVSFSFVPDFFSFLARTSRWLISHASSCWSCMQGISKSNAFELNSRLFKCEQ